MKRSSTQMVVVSQLVEEKKRELRQKDEQRAQTLKKKIVF